METRPADTDAETYRRWLSLLRDRDSGQRLEDVLAFCDQMRQLALDGIALRHPDYTPREVELALRRSHWGEAVYREVYPEGPFLAT